VHARVRREPGEVVLASTTRSLLLGDETILRKAAARWQVRSTSRAPLRPHARSGERPLLGRRWAGDCGHLSPGVTFGRLSKDALDRYLARASGASAPGRTPSRAGSSFIQGVRGDYFNVVGLPVALLADMLKKSGVGTLSWLP